MTAIWVILTAVIIAFTFFALSTVSELNSGNDFIYFLEEINWMIQPWTSAIYFIVWICLFITLGFIIRNYYRNPQKWQSIIMWGIFTVLIFLAVIFFIMMIAGMQSTGDSDGEFWDNFGAMASSAGPWFSASFLIIYLIAYEFMYLALKFITTILFCRDKRYSIKLKVFHGMPICHCKEAFSALHTVVIYLLPVIFMYSFLFIACVNSAVKPLIMLYFFFMIFFMSYDLTVVVYSLFFKIKDSVDYISIDYHIYDVTLYKKSYVKFKRKIKTSHMEDRKYLESGKFNWSR
jgi:hypothetical protein